MSLQGSCLLAPQWRAGLVEEIRRKSIHITGLSVPLGILVLGREATALLIASALVIALIIEAGRLRGLIRLPAVRDHEEERVAGYIYYILGSLLTVVLFQPMIAFAAMLMLSLGDAASGLLGSVLENSNVRGLTGGLRVKPAPIVACMLLSCLLIGYISSAVTGLPLRAYFAGAAGATLADSVAISLGGKPVDDNLTIPLISGALMSIAMLPG